jgi:thiol-disulfide isomerase/thioredoxin
MVVRGQKEDAMRRKAVCHVTIIVAALGLLLGEKVVDARQQLLEAMGMTTVPPKAAPDFTLLNIDGQQVSLQQYRGKVVFLNFWATWCIPCREEMPALERLHQTYQAQDLAIISIDLKEGVDQVKAFFQKHGLSFPSLLDTNGVVFRDYLVAGMPTTYLIDRDGTMVARGVGGRDWTRAEALQLIQELLKPTPAVRRPASQVSSE